VEGKSRSPSIACIYVMTITGTLWSDAINSLRGVRTLVDPNFAFQRQLKYFYDKLMVQVNIFQLFLIK
jgi:protein-tyrosine phosphatase